ncbi:MAG: DNA-protecting protein DprA [Gammaproteobacteria bacterium]|nr:MAG: DNA-protecting protein DprA [Gammaproteobacteria bacterium]
MSTLDWLRLGLSRGLNGHQLQRLLPVFGDPAAILAARPAQLAALGLPEAAAGRCGQVSARLLERSLRWLEQPGHALLRWDENDYPPLLREIPDPPVLLFLRGRRDSLTEPQLAIVGSRAATPAGRDDARQFARAFVAAGLTITSGLARGIDTAAHEAALAAGGQTIAVCGTGLDRIYPAANARLADSIAAGGTLLSEHPPGTPALAAHFPRRNRLISGLALGVLVVEAGWRSGALITARLAAEQGREVFALPGSIHNPLSRGCHRLIRNGAKLVENISDIAEELGPLLGSHRNAIQQNIAGDLATADAALDDGLRGLLEQLGWEPASIDQLVARSGLTAAEVSSMLMILELAGRVRPLPGGLYQQREEGVHHERNRA